MTARKPRPAARVLVIDPETRLLLFRFVPPVGTPFWATPGGACDPGEGYAAAARRELMEETGLDLDPGCEVARRHVEFTTLEGIEVAADERYFLVRTDSANVTYDGHTELERRVMTEHRWWALDELKSTCETVFPEDLADLVRTCLGQREDAKAR